MVNVAMTLPVLESHTALSFPQRHGAMSRIAREWPQHMQCSTSPLATLLGRDGLECAGLGCEPGGSEEVPSDGSA